MPRCPASHPVPVPWLSYNIHYAITANYANWRLSSDNYPLNLPGGGSMHGDWIYGWTRSILEKIVDNCVRVNADCHTNIISATEELF